MEFCYLLKYSDNSANNQNGENEAAQEEPPAYEGPPDYEEASSLKLDMTLRRSSTTTLETHRKRRRSRSRSRSRSRFVFKYESQVEILSETKNLTLQKSFTAVRTKFIVEYADMYTNTV